MRLTSVGPAARDAWSSVAATDPSALVTQTPTWLDCVCASGSYEDATRAYRSPEGRQVVLPLARLRTVPSAMRVESSMPFGWGTGGLVCSDGRLSTEDVAAVVADLSSEYGLGLAVRPSPAAESAWAAAVPRGVVRTRHMAQTVDLSGGFDDVWTNRFSGRVRRNSRKAERMHLTAEWDDTGRLVPVFDALYRKSVARWAQRQHEPLRLALWRAQRRNPRRKFEIVAERFRAACRVWVVWRNGEPAAAIVVVAHGEHSTYWRGAMDQAVAAGTGANELLHCLAIEDACRAGRRRYHMGDSAPSSSLARFKRGFGAEAEHYTGYRFERLPLTAADDFLRRQVKRAIRFRD